MSTSSDSDSLESFEAIFDLEESSENEQDQIEELRESLRRATEERNKFERELKLLRMQKGTEWYNHDTDIEATIASLEGSWKIVSSSSVEQFLEHNKFGEVYALVFQAAIHHINFIDDGKLFVRLCDTVGYMHYNGQDLALGDLEHIEEHNVLKSTKKSWFTGNTLMVVTTDGKQDYIEKRYVKDGKLYLEVIKNDLGCIRIYQRLGEPDEVEELRKEIKKISMELEKKQGSVEQLTGNWRQTKTRNSRLLSIKFEIGKFFRKSVNLETDKLEEIAYNVYELNKKSPDNFITTIENGKVVQKLYNSKEEVMLVRERFVENGMLISVQTRVSEKKTDRWEFERIGEPLDWFFLSTSLFTDLTLNC